MKRWVFLDVLFMQESLIYLSIFLFVHNADILLTENGTEELTKAIKSFREDQLGKKCTTHDDQPAPGAQSLGTVLRCLFASIPLGGV